MASFTVRADAAQSARWKQATDAEGLPSVGVWLARAADAYLKVRARAGLPLPLAWHRGRFRVRLEDGTELEVPGWVARPFGIFRGNDAGPLYHGCHLYTLAHLPSLRLVATFRTAGHCKALASELARLWVRWDGAGTEPPSQDPAAIAAQHLRDAK